MIGVIRRRNILAHPFVTIRCFGSQVFFRALIAGHSQTFLSLLADTKGLQPPTVKVPEVVERCVKLELQALRWSADSWPPQRKGLLPRESTARRTGKHGSGTRTGSVVNNWLSSASEPISRHTPAGLASIGTTGPAPSREACGYGVLRATERSVDGLGPTPLLVGCGSWDC